MPNCLPVRVGNKGVHGESTRRNVMIGGSECYWEEYRIPYDGVGGLSFVMAAKGRAKAARVLTAILGISVLVCKVG